MRILLRDVSCLCSAALAIACASNPRLLWVMAGDPCLYQPALYLEGEGQLYEGAISVWSRTETFSLSEVIVPAEQIESMALVEIDWPTELLGIWSSPLPAWPRAQEVRSRLFVELDLSEAGAAALQAVASRGNTQEPKYLIVKAYIFAVVRAALSEPIRGTRILLGPLPSELSADEARQSMNLWLGCPTHARSNKMR